MEQKTMPLMSGVVTPPADLQPAIDSLGIDGQSLIQWCRHRFGKITPAMIARAANYERGEPFG